MSTKQKEASKATSKKIAKLKEDKLMKEFGKATESLTSKKEGPKKEIARLQFEQATSQKGVGEDLSKKLKKGDMSSIKKIADAAADDKQLEKTLEKMSRDVFRGGGRAMYKSGMRVCKLAKRGRGRAYGKNS